MDNDGPFTANIWSHANHHPSPLALSTPSFHGQRKKIRTNCHCVIRTPRTMLKDMRHTQIVLLMGCRDTCACVCFQFTTVGSYSVYITSYRFSGALRACVTNAAAFDLILSQQVAPRVLIWQIWHHALFLMHSKSGFVSPAETTQLWGHCQKSTYFLLISYYYCKRDYTSCD